MTLSRKYRDHKRFSAIPGSVESIRDLEKEMTRVVHFENKPTVMGESGEKKMSGKGIRENTVYRNRLNQIKKIPKTELINTTKLLSFT